MSLATEKGLRYRKWVDDKRAYVERVSGGRVGYVHMFDMSSASLAQLYVDLVGYEPRGSEQAEHLRREAMGY